MPTADRPTALTPAEYLRIERANDFKCEYLRGEMFAMPRANRYHNLITGNLLAGIGNARLGRPCEAYGVNMRVFVPATGLFTYPDVAIVCEEPAFLDAETDTLLNPDVLIEVTSPATETYDRGFKFQQYRSLPSLREYLLVAQDRPYAERYRRDGDAWTFRDHRRREEILRIDTIDVALPLGEVYRRVTFPTAAPPEPTPVIKPGPPTP